MSMLPHSISVHEREAGDDRREQPFPVSGTEVERVITVLVVDDHIPSLVQIQQGLIALEQGYEVLLAENGEEAISILEKDQVDLVVTDLNMPYADGFGLLSHIKRTQSNLPVVVATGLAPVDYSERLDPIGAVTVMSKPVDPYKLTAEISRLLAETSTGNLHGVTLPGFLQLIEMERKSCAVRVSKGELKGRLHFLSGELVSAYTFDDDEEGVPAARRILSWSDVDIEIERSYHNHKRLIERSLQEILMEAAVRVDESDPEPVLEEATTEVDPEFERMEAAIQAVESGLVPVLEERVTDLGPLPGQEERRKAGDPEPVLEEATTEVDPEFERMEAAIQAVESGEMPDESGADRELRAALERLTDRARQLDDAVAGLIGEVGNFLTTRERIKQMEQQERERRRLLEDDMRKGADTFAHKVLSAAVQALEETLG